MQWQFVELGASAVVHKAVIDAVEKIFIVCMP